MRTETLNSRVRKALEECFPSEKMLDVSDIKLLLLEKRGLRYGKDYSEGNLANVLNKIERGIYQKMKETKK